MQGGDATHVSSWSCLPGVCEIAYDLEATESLQQLRVGNDRVSVFPYCSGCWDRTACFHNVLAQVKNIFESLKWENEILTKQIRH